MKSYPLFTKKRKSNNSYSKRILSLKSSSRLHSSVINNNSLNKTRKNNQIKQNAPSPRKIHRNDLKSSRLSDQNKKNTSLRRKAHTRARISSRLSNQTKKNAVSPRRSHKRTPMPSRLSNQSKQNPPSSRRVHTRTPMPSRLSNRNKQNTLAPRRPNTSAPMSSRLSNQNKQKTTSTRIYHTKALKQLRKFNKNKQYTTTQYETNIKTLKSLRKLLQKKLDAHPPMESCSKSLNPSRESNQIEQDTEPQIKSHSNILFPSRDSKQNLDKKPGLIEEINQEEDMDQYSYYQDLFKSLNEIFDNNNIPKLKETIKQLEGDLELSKFYQDLFTHDISNIFGGISMNVELEEMKSKNDPFISSLSRLTGRGINLISNVRKLTSSSETKISVNLIEVLPFLDISIKNIIESFKDRTIEIRVNSTDQDNIVRGNELLIDVFENILHNAVKYTSNEKPIVEIEINISKFNDGKEQFIKFEFIDHGIGIPDDKKDKTFVRSENRGSKGMGIGLSLVKKLVDILGGRIWVENRIVDDYKRGSKFILLLKSSSLDSERSNKAYENLPEEEIDLRSLLETLPAD